MSLAELAAAEEVTAPTMSRIVEGLVKEGLATREADPANRRKVLIAATEEGRRRLEGGARAPGAGAARPASAAGQFGAKGAGAGRRGAGAGASLRVPKRPTRPARPAPPPRPRARRAYWRAAAPADPRRRAARAARSSERIIALIGPTAAGVIEKRSRPIPIRAIASSVRPPISPQTPTGTPARIRLANDPPQEAKDGRAQPVVALGQLGMGAVGGEQELGEVVGADRQEIDLGQKHDRAARPKRAPRASRRSGCWSEASSYARRAIRAAARRAPGPRHIPRAPRPSGT